MRPLLPPLLQAAYQAFQARVVPDGVGLAATQVGILTGLPSMLFAFAAVPGSLLIARLGVRTALVLGIAVNAIGGALRGAVPDIFWLYAMTIAMGAGVAIMQVTLPPAVRLWLPHKIGFGTAVYTNGLLVGEIAPVALTLPLVLPLVGTWQMGFVFWSAPVAIIAWLVLLFAPRPGTANGSQTRRRWLPSSIPRIGARAAGPDGQPKPICSAGCASTSRDSPS